MTKVSFNHQANQRLTVWENSRVIGILQHCNSGLRDSNLPNLYILSRCVHLWQTGCYTRQIQYCCETHSQDIDGENGNYGVVCTNMLNHRLYTTVQHTWSSSRKFCTFSTMFLTWISIALLCKQLFSPITIITGMCHMQMTQHQLTSCESCWSYARDNLCYQKWSDQSRQADTALLPIPDMALCCIHALFASNLTLTAAFALTLTQYGGHFFHGGVSSKKFAKYWFVQLTKGV